ncbi:uncharacterized protein LOC110692603 [Chenopodium quinoa]|uniref:uncharacterized protein LOC110692603 n=1 Tax=Chenopodium quinoa TaxID=63459 RepID=UPI000B76BEC2|nr:uncharacterized protein LOC110692603 [Chenopodium quinoa]
MTVEKPVTEQEKAKALVLLRHHLHEGLKTEYMMVEVPKNYGIALMKDLDTTKGFSFLRHYLTGQIYVTDEQMIEKTLTTFHASNILQEQYRERGFKKFNELMSVLLVAEQNSDLLLKNHNLRQLGSLATHHEANATSSYPPETNATRRGGRGNYNGRGRGRGNYRGRGRGRGRNNFQRNNLYQASVKGKEKNAEANYVNEENAPCPTLDVSDFFMDNAEIRNDFVFGEINNA